MTDTTQDGKPRQRCQVCSPGRPPAAELATTGGGKVDVEEAIRLRDQNSKHWSFGRLGRRYGCSRQWVARCVAIYQGRKSGEPAKFQGAECTG